MSLSDGVSLFRTYIGIAATGNKDTVAGVAIEGVND
jgi:hypothetical protein